jgi:hypothetical protein
VADGLTSGVEPGVPLHASAARSSALMLSMKTGLSRVLEIRMLFILGYFSIAGHHFEA